MQNEEMLKFVKRWRALEAAQKDLDFARSTWARDLRSHWAGNHGDEKFVQWCETELGLSAAQSAELLARAAARALVTDPKEWSDAGGFVRIRPLVGLPKREVAACLSAAKAGGYALSTVLRQRGHGAAPAPVGRAAPFGTAGKRAANANASGKAPATTSSLSGRALPTPSDDDAWGYYEDAVSLSQFVAANVKQIPKAILAIVLRYSRASKRDVG